MADEKKSIVVYADWIELFETLTDEEAGKLIKHFFRYTNDLDPIAPDRITELSFIPIKQSLKRDLKKWEGVLEDRSVSGRLGNLKRWNLDIYNKIIAKEITIEEGEIIAKHRKTSQPDKISRKGSQSIANIADSVSVSVNVSDSDILLKKETKEEIKNFEISKNQIFGNKILESQSWVEVISMQNKILPEEIPKWVSEFNKKLLLELDTKISKKEYASHFSRWLPGELLKKQNQNGKSKPIAEVSRNRNR